MTRENDCHLHEDAGKWLGSGWGLKQNNKPVPVPNLIFKLPTVVDRNQLGRLTITQRVRLVRADAALKVKQRAKGIRVVTIIEKLCGGCDTVKKAEGFNKNRERADGLQLRCRRCQNFENAASRKRKKLKKAQEMPGFEGTIESLSNLKIFKEEEQR